MEKYPIVKKSDDTIVIQTSERSFKVITDYGEEYYLWADPHTKFLKCSCPISSFSSKRVLCAHMLLVKKLFNHKVNKDVK